MNTQQKHYSTYAIFFGVLLVSGLSYLLPVATEVVHETEHHWRVMFSFAMATSFCSAAVLFFKGLGNFKTGLRVAYSWFAFGIILFGVALLQWPILILRGLAGGFWVSSGAIIIPFIFATALMYIGMRQFVKLLGIRTKLSNLPLVFISVFVFALLSAVLNHIIALNNATDIEAETYTATVGWSISYAFFAWLIVLKVRGAIGDVYRVPMKWLAIAMGSLVAAGTHEYATSYFMGEANWYLYTGLSIWPFVVTGFLLIWAAHEFNLLLRIQQPSLQVLDEADVDRAFIDGITNIAGLASRPEDIDKTLDGLRTITAGMKSGAVLSKLERNELVSIYIKLENYLTTADPLRTYAKEDLRQRIVPAFRVQIEHSE